MTQPFLIIGCGGSGGKVVLGLRERLLKELERKGATIRDTQGRSVLPSAWQLKWIDVPTPAEEHPNFGGALPLDDYLALANVDNYDAYDAALTSGSNLTRLDRLVGWRPSPTLPLPVQKGAGQMRAVGRAVSLTRVDAVKGLIRDALDEIGSGQAQLEQTMSRIDEGAVGTTPIVIVVSSMAGGTGAGIFLDVCDIVRGVKPDLDNRIFGVLFTAEIFGGVESDAAMIPNTVASVAELMSGYLAADRELESLYGQVGGMAVKGRSGPSFPFIIGMNPLNSGAPLESAAQCYRAVTETLLASMTNSRFAQDFLNHQISNFLPNSGPTKRLTKYRMLNQPRMVNDATVPCGVVSSFGSAQVSVGTQLFASWATDRLTRAVIDHVSYGWREFGQSLMKRSNAPIADSEVIDFLVAREEYRFFDQCGLHEQDEPDGTKHDQVLQGILSEEEMRSLTDAFRTNVLTDIDSSKALNGTDWTNEIYESGHKFSRSTEESAIAGIQAGYQRYASELTSRIEGTTARYVAEFGIPVTKRLLKSLREQCGTASRQLRQDLEKSREGRISLESIKSSIGGAFAGLGKNKTSGNSDPVMKGIAKVSNFQWLFIDLKRKEQAIKLMDLVSANVLDPLETALDELSSRLDSELVQEQIKAWPDGAGVSEIYRPAPTQKVLLEPEQWDSNFVRLMNEVAQSVDNARDQIAAGGFQFGDPINPQNAGRMLEIDEYSRWWDDNSRPARIHLRLDPRDVRERAGNWLWNESENTGKFVRMGLEEYLSEAGASKMPRLEAFERALTAARDLAQPLVSIPRGLINSIHPGHSDLPCNFVCQPFPFPPDMNDAREAVERIMHSISKPDGGWFRNQNTSRVESVLLTSVLEFPVQPGAVMSLCEPIYSEWNEVRNQPATVRGTRILGFWSYNRARLLTESIPLTLMAQKGIIKGWFIGRLLGMISNPTENQPFIVHHTKDGAVQSAALPWPILLHGRVHDLHKVELHKTKYLPGLLEHVGLAMMLLGHEPRALDGYDLLFQIGEEGESIVAQWILDGSNPVSSGVDAQVSGENPESRRVALTDAIQSLSGHYGSVAGKGLNSAEWTAFSKIPFGVELFPLFVECLGEIGTMTDIDIGPVIG